VGRTRLMIRHTSEFTRLVYVHDAYWLRADIVGGNNGRGSTASCMRGRSSAKQLSATLSECVRNSASRCAGSPTDLWEGAQHPFWDGVCSLRRFKINFEFIQLFQNPTHHNCVPFNQKFQHYTQRKHVNSTSLY